MSIQKLSDRVYTNGFYYDLVSRSGDWAIYSQHHTPHDKPLAYEVFRIRIAKPRTLKDKYYPEREAFPPSSQWGNDAWTISDKKRAVDKFLVCSGMGHLRQSYQPT